jgi:conjugative relaxase-like TrwC/TraI family protein
MLTISKPLGAQQAATYHSQEFTAPDQNYWSKGQTQGEWHGKLATQYGLIGGVSEEHFALLAQGKHPFTKEQLVRHHAVPEYTDAQGKKVAPAEHRAGWDATFSAPKSVSLTALVGGDHRIIEAHREAVNRALDELERYTAARLGGNRAAEDTGKFVVAKFEHDTARPVDGYAAPQLHTHCVIFNVTERENGKTNALQPQALFDTQSFANAVYHSELMHRLQQLGYEIDPGKIRSGRGAAPEIKGYTPEYLEASSPRSKQIREYLEKMGHEGPAAAQIAAHNTREKKEPLSLPEVMAAHRRIAKEYGNQAERVVLDAMERGNWEGHGRNPTSTMVGKSLLPVDKDRAQEAVSYARDRNYEREAVVDKRAIYRDALRRGMGDITFDRVQANFDTRIAQGEFRLMPARKHQSGHKFTTDKTIRAEKEVIRVMLEGQGVATPILSGERARAQIATADLNAAQRMVVEKVLTSRDLVHGLQGVAGSGKTTALDTVRQAAEQRGYAVEGFAPTSRASQQLRDAGISASTLQSFLHRGDKDKVSEDPTRRHLYMLDESSLTSTNQVREFLRRLGPSDRVLLIGDIRQHQAVDAGKPFEQLQAAGMATAQLNQVIRQKDPVMLHSVEHLSHGRTVAAMQMLEKHGHITEISQRAERVQAIADAFVAKPENTIIVSADNASRLELNKAVREKLQEDGTVSRVNHALPVLAARSEMSGAERAWASRYEIGNVVQYHRRSESFESGSYAKVVAANHKGNLLTVQKPEGELVTYDPLRLRGITAYREVEKEFAVGDRIQFKAPDRNLKVSNGDLATITWIEGGRITVRTEESRARTLTFDAAKMGHFDHGYAVTSHSSQGITAQRVLINMDSNAHPELINTRFAYVSISRASHDVQIFTDDILAINKRICRDVSKTSAVEPERTGKNHNFMESNRQHEQQRARNPQVNQLAYHNNL